VSKRNIVVIGGSAGAMPVVYQLLEQFPVDADLTVCIALHLPATASDWLVGRLAQAATGWKVVSPRSEEPLRCAHIYIARPDHHLVMVPEGVLSTRGPRENQWRPAIDVLFRTAAVTYGPRVLGILLSGELDDGTMGLTAIHRCGGVTIVQDPEDAPFPGMPGTALANVEINHSVAAAQLAPLILRLAATDAPPMGDIPDDLKIDAAFAVGQRPSWPGQHANTATELTCPDCNGPLWQRDEKGTDFRCLVGHAYRLQSLLQASEGQLDQTLWAAIRLFEQRANLARRMADQERGRGQTRRFDHYLDRAREAEEHAVALRGLQAGYRDDVPDAQEIA
jgi:two-component system, chemotaxis family, protein-glutamate methylesterase/glutaminase